MNSGPHDDTVSALSHKAISLSLFCLFLLPVLSQRPLLLVDCISNWILMLNSCPRCRHITAVWPSLYEKTSGPPKDGLHCSKWSFSGYLSSLGFVWIQFFFHRGLCWRLQFYGANVVVCLILKQTVKLWGHEDEPVGYNACWTDIRTWVQIPNTHKTKKS